jgi:very-short-patch-repair endonuclease
MAKVSVKSMTPEERREWMRVIGRRGAAKGGKARAKQFTSASQRSARKHLSPEKAAENGRRGAARTIELHGYKALFDGCRRKRLANPTPTELVMMGLLKTLGLKYRREHQLGETLFTLDFYLAKFRLGIEVDGSIHDAGKPGEAKRIQHAERKDALCQAMKIKLIRIHHSELADDDLSDVINKIAGVTRNASAGDRREQTGISGEPPDWGEVV